VAAIAAAATAMAAGSAGAVTPANGGDAGGTLVAVNTSTGSQTDPHVSGDLAAYENQDLVNGSTIHYFDFATGIDAMVPAGAPGDSDHLSDVGSNRIVFSRTRARDGQTAAMLFDAASGVLQELDPQPIMQRFETVIGGQTVAYEDFADPAANGDVYAYDLATGTATNLSQSSAVDENPAVAPSGNVVVWESCVGADCDILESVRSGGVWGAPTPVAATPSAYDRSPDTDGTTVVYADSDPQPSTYAHINLRPVAGGSADVLELPGSQWNPSISRGVVTFESSSTLFGIADVYVYVLATHTVYRVTDTPTVNERLSDVTVLPSGAVRVVWASYDPSNCCDFDVYARTFTVPLTPSAFSGFFSPVGNPPVVNVAKGGQAIPVKFSLGGNQGLNIFAAGYPISQQIACDSSAPLDDVEQTVAAGSSSLSYDATTNTYTYVWKTDKAWAGTCRQLTLRLTDGTDHIAYLNLK
jgi:hypothetical protein